MKTSLIENLVHAGTAPAGEIDQLVATAGLDAVVRLLIEEIIFRCELPANRMPVNVALTISHRDEVRRVVLHVHRDGPVRTNDEPGPVVWSELGLSLANLLQRLFGPASLRQSGDFTNAFLAQSPYPAHGYHELPGIVLSTTQATGTVMTGLTSRPADLGNISLQYESDKWASLHWYTPHYEQHFARFRDRPIRLLEIGIGGYDRDLGGGSLKMWKRYFPRGLIFGLDIFDKTELSEPRLTALVGDQNDPAALVALAEEHGPFDIIIDDGSHKNEHVRTSFATLLGQLNDGGLYVIEDLQTAYKQSYGGSTGGVAGPHTSVGLVKSLLDDLHHREHGGHTLTEDAVTGIHAYHNIVFIEKGVNGEAGQPAWLDSAAWVMGLT